ncbi:glycosyltransferase WbuB [Cronobacter sakazakii]|uniref:glycosyltransferase family 4 protein n=1 Tax=Cronobacter sakazakii TaxID=28141 RepID=UPI000BE90A67|nr:glycosyltransferase family 4 protein [Cronobacter sakazakii]EKY2102326.1 glycosyltransferase family 4 protein [Cronobacter sakazakii]ELQ5983765.1 glycosyltransferase family 4 protein [Cronobacter sakazakii]ELY2486282.1 glycosyltransferase family 4 protein [Cronobacter sakazakii]ELY2764421.1 glycosyltransferase family 4 protein [Cronobacter sakazakii]ELY3749497.1 glycosyltransferase family 4 protein [Cronobacter sakazakii]
MKLALIIDDYLPNSTRVGAKMFHELAQEFLRNGHDVTVITPDTTINKALSVDNVDGVTTWCFKSGALKDVNKILRAINETLLSWRAWRSIKNRVQHDTFDGIVYYSPSIFWGGLVKKIKAHCQCPAYLILRDLFPQWVIDAGMIKNDSVIAQYFRLFEKQTYAHADRIGLMSEKNLEIFRTLNKGYPCEVLRNWASLKPVTLPENYASLRQRLGLEDKVIFFYGGNIGHAQDMSNLLRLTRKMSSHPQAHFLFIGQGDEVELINNLARKWNLSNFTYLPSVKQDDFKFILSEMDIGLFSLSARHSAHNFPGKLLGYMVESLPILGSVNAGNDLLDVINDNNAGFIHVNGEDDKLYHSARALLMDASLRQQMGAGAHTLLKKQFSVHSAAQAIVMRLEALQCA